MVPLAVHRQVLTWCCVYPPDENTSKWEKLSFKAFAFVIFVSLLSTIAVSVAYIAKFMSTDLGGSLHALFQITAYTGLSYVALNGFILRDKITAIFSQLTQIYNESKNFYLFHHIFNHRITSSVFPLNHRCRKGFF